MTDEQIARVCHEANRAYCLELGDGSQMAWDDAPEWQQSSAVNGAAFHRVTPYASASHSHEEWLHEKRENGWVYGEEKDADEKTHPCIVPFNQLPREQQLKDILFKAIVGALADPA